MSSDEVSPLTQASLCRVSVLPSPARGEGAAMGVRLAGCCECVRWAKAHPRRAHLALRLCALVPRKLSLVGSVIRLIDGELVHCRLPQMLGKPGRSEIQLTLPNPLGQHTV